MSDIADEINSRLAARGLPPDAAPTSLAVVEGEGDIPFVEIRPVLSQMAREIGAILANNGVFCRQRNALTIARDGRLLEMSARRFRTYCEDHLVTFQWVPGKKPGDFTQRPVTISVEAAATILESDQFIGRQREISRVATVRQPVRRKDGRIELLPYGYDAESKIFTLDTGVEFEHDMSLDDARTILRALLREFPFGDRRSTGLSRNEAIVIAGLLSMFGGPLLSATARRLNFMFSSNSVGSGKTLLAQIIVTTVLGLCDVQPVPETEENWRKILDTECLAGSPYILFDDVNGFFRSQILNAFLTAPTWSGRRMHSQSKFAVPKLATVFLTGNNLEVSPDVARRFLHCKMVTDEADPQARKIEHVISDEWIERPESRRQILGALWAIVREWDRAGRPAGSRAVRGYEAWSECFGGMVSFAGFGDPLEPLPVEESGNSELADMVALLEELAKGVDDRAEFVFPQIVDAARERNCFSWMLEGKESGEGDGARFTLTAKANSRFGKMLSEQYGGKKFTLPNGRIVRWDERGKKRGKTYTLEILN